MNIEEIKPQIPEQGLFEFAADDEKLREIMKEMLTEKEFKYLTMESSVLRDLALLRMEQRKSKKPTWVEHDHMLD